MTEIAAKYNTVVVNGGTTSVSKNPSYMPGIAPVNVLTSTVGSSIHYTHDPNYEEAGGELRLPYRNEIKWQEMAKQMALNIAKNSIEIIDVNSGSVLVFENMSVSEKLDFSNEEEFEITLKGSQAA